MGIRTNAAVAMRGIIAAVAMRGTIAAVAMRGIIAAAAMRMTATLISWRSSGPTFLGPAGTVLTAGTGLKACGINYTGIVQGVK